MRERHERHMVEISAAIQSKAHENDLIDDDNLCERQVDHALEDLPNEDLSYSVLI